MLHQIHTVGRRVFLLADGAFRRVFSDRTNPLYYLGSIGCFMFAVVVVSGFYVYAFYETGVDTTYPSVERLTHQQWWLGGVMRSLHRYASDALVLVMLLHMGRHFFFDQYRGFRAFSWVSGVVLLWLVYVSGINGYMLPWDQLAQFTLVATAEWFDALPVFRGTMVRNFILPEAITDRFFSLLQFLHIGVPLAALAALWIHIQRVPRARIAPPRPLAIGLGLMLLAVSLAKPALGQGAADLSQSALAVSIDWFYLSVLPLAQSWSAIGVWLVLALGTVLALLLPWLPPQRLRAGAWQLTLHPGPHTVPVRAGETLLEAGLRAELALPFECRAGGCGKCRASVLNGQVEPNSELAVALSAEQRARGDILMCCACALSDLEIEFEPGAALRDHAAATYTARVVQLEPLAHEVMRLVIELADGRRIAYSAGQYIQIVLDDGERRAYSFTSAGDSVERIELHIRRIPGGRFTTQLFERMRVGDALTIEGPMGEFVLHEPSDKPLIFVAGATGFAPVKSLLEQALRDRIAKPLHFYWGVRRPHDFYLLDLLQRWQSEHANFHFVPVVSEPLPEDGWSGRTGLVHQAILHDFADLSGASVYACGSMRMVQAARPAFLAQGLAEDACFSDAFTPSPGATAPG